LNTDFQALAGVALIVFAICAPLAYCTAQRGGPTTAKDLHLACINARGEWKAEGWGPYTCVYPKTQSN